MASLTCISIRLQRQFANNVLYAIPYRCRYRQILYLPCLLTQGDEVPCLLCSPRQETLR